ncbi:MAG TPA: c-type cytochrome [Pyrinomonadaceae bacterium]|nr:c-type cytochrome [Pyrinomonadaceae bacterium]
MERRKQFIQMALVVLAVAGAILSVGYTVRKDRAHAPMAGVKFARTPERLERGRYIVESTAHCFQCHSDVDYSKPGAQPKPGQKGAGAVFAEDGMEWLVAPNITPDVETGAGSWTDEQLARAIREGIGHDGRRLFPVMPYMNFRNMSDEDLASVITYIRSIEPVRNKLPKTQIPEPLKAALPPHEPITSQVSAHHAYNQVARGRYMATLGNCVTCHTPMNQNGQPMMEMAFAGGFHLKGSWGDIYSANITPDPTGISYYDEALFIRTMRTGHVGARKLNYVMPTGYFKNMTDDDLKAIFAYLRTLRPVKHRLDNTEEATLCPLDGQKHGFGDRNHKAE